ncbi:unnamed protein product [Parascedosporium putredinis]|uniref:FAD-binding PCMH-type domain-containing protein n=1 Tax=Parascedosporium putredinis TaxID=1442378 RepID=A0A9P1GYX5_9PEZI|nr:unnamed protein product [Parascedosporium putredinis]CAI7991095.1 unnamed protein product [Parascedosporium putredinis]
MRAPSSWTSSRLLVAALALGAKAAPDPTAELTAQDIGDFAAVEFGDRSVRGFPGPRARPSPARTAGRARGLAPAQRYSGGALLRPNPPAIVCYEGPAYDEAACKNLWPQGSTCLPTEEPVGNCTRGLPEYVVNVTSVKHVQAAVNFARNKNVRLVIKNTGHDFGGRSVGAGSLSVWTHNLKDFELIPEYRMGPYKGMAVRYGAGLEAWELYNHMAELNFTVTAAGGRTVGANGGWFASGGHGTLTSTYGLGCDQALEIHAVTADGEYVVANPLALSCKTGANSTTSFRTDDPAAFWDAMSIYFRFSAAVVDAGGVDWSYLTPLGNETYTFSVGMTWPNRTVEAVTEILAPLYEQLQAIGPRVHRLRAARGHALPLPPLPRKNWDDDEVFANTFAAIRVSVEAGYTFHGLAIGATKKAAGWPGREGAVNPAWRNGVLHGILIGLQPKGLTAQEARDEEAAIQEYMQLWRDVTPARART